MESKQLLLHAQRLQAVAQAGLAYGSDAYDRVRYEEVRAISVELLAEFTEEPFEKIVRVFASEGGYQTPKVDVRAVVVRNNHEILLVSEKGDQGRWTLPGGWADIGYTPFEIAAKEVYEETGLIVKPVRLLALFDKKMHPHPPQPWYVYKAFVNCKAQSGVLLQETAETKGARWFTVDEVRLSSLSTDRVTLSQLETIYRLAFDPLATVLCD